MREKLRLFHPKNAAVGSHPKIARSVFGDRTNHCGWKPILCCIRSEFAIAEDAQAAAKCSNPELIVFVAIKGPNGIIGQSVGVANDREFYALVMVEPAAIGTDPQSAFTIVGNRADLL